MKSAKKRKLFRLGIIGVLLYAIIRYRQESVHGGKNRPDPWAEDFWENL